MFVRELTFEGFRNLRPGVFRPGQGVNILYGDNAQGKTNLLEACWLFTGARSFRGAKDSEMVAFGGERAALSMAFNAGGREQEADIAIEKRRRATLNGVPLPAASRLAGVFCGVVFSPAHLSLVKDGPEGRRRFLDAAYCQLKPGYIGTLSDYQKVLTQRNAFLKGLSDRPSTGADEELLDLWDRSLAVAGARLTVARSHYIHRLQPLVTAVYDGLSGGREQLTLSLETGIDTQGTPAELAVRWLEVFAAARRADIGAGFSTAGPHRDDLGLYLGDRAVKTYGSQGQQRSAVLALKLAEASLLEQVSGEPPVAFLDDVMSELDVSRQDYILNHIEGWQVFITCCEPSSALRATAGQVFQIKQGVLL